MKNNFYFQHDYHSRDDGKLLEIRMKHGMSGVGTYWCLVEMLHEGGGYIETKQNLLAFQLQVDQQIITDIVQLCFSVEDDKITSNRVKLNLYEREQKKIANQEKGKIGAQVRWNKNKPDPNQGIVEVINNNSSTIVEPYSNHSTTIVNDSPTIVNDTKEKGKEKGKEKDKDKEKLNKLKSIWKYELNQNMITEEQLEKLTLNMVYKNFIKTPFAYENWSIDLNKKGASRFLLDLNKEIPNEVIALVKTYELLNK